MKIGSHDSALLFNWVLKIEIFHQIKNRITDNGDIFIHKRIHWNLNGAAEPILRSLSPIGRMSRNKLDHHLRSVRRETVDPIIRPAFWKVTLSIRSSGPLRAEGSCWSDHQARFLKSEAVDPVIKPAPGGEKPLIALKAGETRYSRPRFGKSGFYP